MLALSGIGKVHGRGPEAIRALSDVDLQIAKGDCIALTGRSGSGKSTLLAILGCLDQATTGRYVLDGEEVSALDADRLAHLRNRKIGFVFQNFHLMGRMSALRNVALPLVYRGIPLREREALARAALQRVGLADRAADLPGQLSGGQRQRVAIARALVGRPALVLADEPTGNLDSATAADVMGMFHDLHREGFTLVLVTHDAALAATCPRRIHLEDGRIHEAG